MSTTLTDDELPKLPPSRYSRWSSSNGLLAFSADQMEAYADAREAAVLAKLAQQAPVAWIRPSGKAMLEAGGSCTVYASDGMSNYSAPLYTHPAPQQAEKQCQHGAWIDCGICDKPHAHPAPQQADRQRVPEELRDRIAEAHDASLDDDHTGCRSILNECLRMLAGAAVAPAQAEPLCPNCGGSGEQAYLVGRGPDAHDEFGPCSVCDGVGIQPQASAVDERAIDAAARKIAECMDYPWEHMPEKGRSNMREHAKAVLDAARNALAQKGGAA